MRARAQTPCSAASRPSSPNSRSGNSVIKKPRSRPETHRNSSTQVRVSPLAFRPDPRELTLCTHPPQIGDQIAYCVLDGDGCIFHRDLISKGREGGREAARLLTEHVQQYAEDQGVKGQLTVVIHIFVNKQGLGKVLAVS